MLTVRTRIGLTQAELAKILGVSRKSIGDWERGTSYPQAINLKQFIAFAIQHQAFPAGRVVEEVRAMWNSAHQKVLFDETWLTTLLPPLELSLSLQPVKETTASDALAHREDWNDAPAVPTLYGREWEIDLLTGWVAADRCQLVSLLGLGGVGKSALAVSLMHLLAEHFEVVIWRSLRNLSTSDELIEELLQFLAPGSIRREATSLERRQRVLLEQMRKTRVLLVLDGLEALLEKGEVAGRMLPEFESFERFLNLTAETEHESCVLLTSREALAVLVPLEGSQGTVRSLRIAPLDAASCDKLLSDKELIGNAPDRTRLIEAYTGNPLALKIVAHTIVDLFDGEIVPFLEKGEVIIGGVRSLLEEQFYRLSSLEQSLLLWLTILREPTTIDTLLEAWAAPVSRARLLEALDGLYRRSLIERGFKPHEFAPQSLVIEYLTTWQITQATAEDQEEKLERLIEHSLEQANMGEDVR
jgi:DNA-binding XRE family transcriptional regulator